MKTGLLRHSYGDLYHAQRRRERRLLFVLSMLLLFTLALSLCAGEHWVMPTEWLKSNNKLFIVELRLPRALAVILVGGALACSGAVMQALFNNPLAEPGLLGVSNWAGVFMVLTLVFGSGVLPEWWLSVNAILGALSVTFLLLLFSLQHSVTNARLLLIGVAFSFIASAIMTWSVYFSSDVNLRQLMYWLMGGFSGVEWSQVGLMAALIPPLLALCLQGHVVNIVSLGEIQARQLGLSLRFWRTLLVMLVGCLVGVSVALAGVISFVGLLVPHLLRLKGVTDHRILLVTSAVTGALVLLLSDLIARLLLGSVELPIGVVTSTLGAPLLIWMLLRQIEL